MWRQTQIEVERIGHGTLRCAAKSSHTTLAHGSTHKRAISVCPRHRVYESRVDRFRGYLPNDWPRAHADGEPRYDDRRQAGVSERSLSPACEYRSEADVTAKDEGAHGNGLQDSSGDRHRPGRQSSERVFHRPGNARARGASRSARTEPRPPITRYKDGGRIKRQAARFRVFKFNQNDAGNLELVGEVTADDAKIEWKVDLCNRKAALDRNSESRIRATAQHRHRGPQEP